jgi:succinate-acetate transporter protein
LALALALGGLTQLLAAMWEFVTGNTYAVTMFGMLSGFYLSAGVSRNQVILLNMHH